MATWSKKTYEMVGKKLQSMVDVLNTNISVNPDYPKGEFARGYDHGGFASVRWLTHSFANKFEADNRAFDKKKFLKDVLGERAFTLLETIVVVSIMMVLVAVALPTMTSLMGNVVEKQAMQLVDAGNAALNLDFAKQIVEGGYESPFPDDKQKVGKKLRKANREALESLLEPGFSHPVGFEWLLVEQATSTQPPVVGYRIRQ